MMNLRRTVMLASLLAFTQIAADAQTPATPLDRQDSETELTELDRRIQEAMVSGDVKLLERSLSDDFVFVHGWFKGGTETKPDLLNKATKVPPRIFIHRKVSSQVVEVHGHVALVLGRLDVRRLPWAKNKETEEMCYALHYVHLYERRQGLWQFLSHRTAQSIEPAKPCPK